MACTSRGTQKSSILGEVPPRNPTSYPFIYHFWRKRYPFRIPSIDNWYPFHIPSLEPVADPGEGPGPPPLIPRPNWGPEGPKNFGEGPVPPYLRVWMTGPPPPPFLSQGLDPALRTLHPLNRNNRFPLEAWKRYPFQAEPPLIGHFREYPLPPGLHREVNGRGGFNTGESL